MTTEASPRQKSRAFTAVALGDHQRLARMFKGGLPVETSSDNGTLLEVAFQKKQWKAFDVILKAGARAAWSMLVPFLDAPADSDEGRRQRDLIKRIHEKDVLIDKNLRQLLWGHVIIPTVAKKREDHYPLGALEKLLALGMSPAIELEGTHRKLIHYALIHQLPKFVEALLKAGAKPDDTADEKNESLLEMAAARWDFLSIETLVKYGVDPKRTIRKTPFTAGARALLATLPLPCQYVDPWEGRHLPWIVPEYPEKEHQWEMMIRTQKALVVAGVSWETPLSRDWVNHSCDRDLEEMVENIKDPLTLKGLRDEVSSEIKQRWQAIEQAEAMEASLEPARTARARARV